MGEFLQTYGTWIVIEAVFLLMMRMHGSGGGHSDHQAPRRDAERPPARRAPSEDDARQSETRTPARDASAEDDAGTTRTPAAARRGSGGMPLREADMNAHRTIEHGRRRRVKARLQRLSPLRWLPGETSTHLRNAAREELLAVRSMLDAAIARLGRVERGPIE